MAKIINLSPEALEIVNQLLDEGHLEDTIVTLDGAEDSLQGHAYESDDPGAINLYSIAYQLKLLKNDFLKLKKILYNGRE